MVLYILLSGSPPFAGSCGGEGCGWDNGEACKVSKIKKKYLNYFFGGETCLLLGLSGFTVRVHPSRRQLLRGRRLERGDLGGQGAVPESAGEGRLQKDRHEVRRVQNIFFEQCFLFAVFHVPGVCSTTRGSHPLAGCWPLQSPAQSLQTLN